MERGTLLAVLQANPPSTPKDGQRHDQSDERLPKATSGEATAVSWTWFPRRCKRRVLAANQSRPNHRRDVARNCTVSRLRNAHSNHVYRAHHACNGEYLHGHNAADRLE